MRAFVYDTQYVYISIRNTARISTVKIFIMQKWSMEYYL